MANGQGLLDRARQHIGEQYVNIQVPKDNANWHGPWDCAEFISWVVFQEAGILYGCINDNVRPAVADAYTGAWEHDARAIGRMVAVAEAAAIPGGIVLRFPPSPGAMGHIAICDGRGGTVEAKGHAFGVVADVVTGRRWDTGVLIPGITYDAAGPVPMPVAGPPAAKLYRIGAPGLDPNVVRSIQRALAAFEVAQDPPRFLDPGTIDGQYGTNTAAAVSAFQAIEGLVVDGEVGPQTAAELNVVL